MKTQYILAELLNMEDLNQYGEKEYVYDPHTSETTNSVNEAARFDTLDNVSSHIHGRNTEYELITVISE